jgi:hypothetical protein
MVLCLPEKPAGKQTITSEKHKIQRGNMEYKLAVCIPTRGILFSETIKSTFLNTEIPQGSTFHVKENLPIPDVFNELVKDALKTECTHILFVEDDMEIPKNGVSKMLEMIKSGSKYVAIDYGLVMNPNERGRTCVGKDKHGNVLYTGTGCTMIQRSLFEEELEMYIGKWFSTDYQFVYEAYPEKLKKVKAKKGYGGHDVYLCYNLRMEGISLDVVPDMRCKHLRLVNLERKRSNNGLYEKSIIL